MKTATSQKKTRNYYKPHNKEEGSTAAKLFLVRHCISNKEVSHDGPYNDEKGANEILNAYLKEGTCAWIVSYNDT
tara:strand:+ start:2210 stop:2434 length:225 start_codon:yes stop_codon:yes gene_type:complete